MWVASFRFRGPSMMRPELTSFTKAADDEEYSRALRAALSMGKQLLDKYYSLTDNSKIYHIAMSNISLLFLLFFVFIIDSSSSPKVQIEVLREAWLGRRVD